MKKHKIAQQGYKSFEELDNLQRLYEAGRLMASPKENLVINPKVGYFLLASDIASAIPTEWLVKNKDVYGTISKLSYQDPVSNLNWDFLHFVNSDVFRPSAIAFQKSERSVQGTGIRPSYTPHIQGTKSYKEFWEEEFKRITTGYEPIIDGKPCGIRISGEFYFYLNYTRIKKIVTPPGGTPKDVEDFPDFLAMDYYYYKELEARENPEKFGLPLDYRRSLCVVKSRRKGFSFKAACGMVWIAAFNNNARVGVASEPHSTDDTDAVKCAKKCLPIIDHLSNYTPFGRKDPGDPKTNGGWKHEIPKITKSQFSFTFGLFNTKHKGKAGRQSTIFTMSLSKDDAASGEGLHRLYFEEAGKIANLNKAWIFSRESMKAGSIFKGIAIIFGTGGEMKTNTGKEGSTKPFSAMYYEPAASELAAFDNIYEYKQSNKKVGYFVCDMWSNFGSYVIKEGEKYTGLDKMGNPYFWVAEAHLNKERLEKMPPKGRQTDYNQFLTQRCKTASEAFLISAGSVFKTADLIARKNYIKMSKGGFDKYRTAGTLVETSGGRVEFKPDLEGVLEPIISTDMDISNKEGCLLVYEHPRTVHGVVPEDAYIITVDPIGKNTSGGKSLNAVIVLKTPKYEQIIGPERIVATYFGRAEERPLDFLHRLLMKLSIYYNARITYENDQDGGILDYFTRRNAINRLLPSPMMVTRKHLPNSKTLLREFGHSMATDRHKSFGEAYLIEWLDYRHASKKGLDENDEPVEIIGNRNLDMLEDELIIDQLINYNREGNFDTVMSLMGGIIQFKERFDQSLLAENNEYVDDMTNQWMEYYDERFGEKGADRYRKERQFDVSY